MEAELNAWLIINIIFTAIPNLIEIEICKNINVFTVT